MADYALTATLVGGTKLKQALASGGQFAREQLAIALNSAAQDVQNKAVELAPHKSGRLWGSLHVGGAGNIGRNATPENLTAMVGTNLSYARYQEEGTGLYGPKKQLIYPRNGKVMAFVPYGNVVDTGTGGGVAVFARSVKGVKPHWYLKQAFEQIKPNWTNYIQTAVQRIIQYLVEGA